jgi:hypothetical protein
VRGQELECLVRAVQLEALVLRPVLLGQAEIVEHGADVEQFRVGRDAPPPPLQHAEQVHAAGVVEQQGRRGGPHQLGRVGDQAGVRDLDASDR